MWLALYVATARSAKNMGMAAQRVRDYLVPFMGEVPLENLRPDTVRGYRLYLQDRGLSLRSVRHLLTDLRCMLHWAIEGGLLESLPFPRRVMPRIQETAPDRLWPDEVRAVLSVSEPYAFMIRLGLGTGLRWGELCRARREHVVQGMLVVEQTKSSKVRRVPLSAALVREIGEREGRLVPYVEAACSSFAKVIRRHSGVARFHVHQLRHTFACSWIESGGSLPALQQILGHASVVTTQMYARLSDDAVRREAERINGTSDEW
jgi:integrase/recombinase XerC